jgi:polyhydroxyalkanoate synthesis regulator phasin
MDSDKSGSGAEREKAVSEELRELARSFSALGRTMFEEGRVLSADLLRSAREAVDRARQEIERMAHDKK